MRVSIQQPEFFPWAGFFNKLADCDRFVIFDNVAFKKRYFDNRCRIRIGDAMHWLTVPVLSKGRYGQMLKDVEIDNGHSWSPEMWRTISRNYARAPFLEEHAAFLEETFAKTQWKMLADLNLHIIRYVAGYLNFGAELILGSSLNAEGSGSDLVLDCCRRVGATQYLSGRFGEEYLNQEDFAASGIKLVFQDFTPQPYRQIHGEYLGPLSLLDTLLNLGKETRNIVIGGGA